MGYRSDVVLMAVFSNAEEREEVLAIYRMDTNVVKHNLEEDWRKVDFGDGPVGLVYEGNDVKWYDRYEDVQGLEHMGSVLEVFHEERGFAYAWAKARIGEEDDDVESHVVDSGCENSDVLREIIYDHMQIVRRIDLSI